jgi:hypothetical protein
MLMDIDLLKMSSDFMKRRSWDYKTSSLDPFASTRLAAYFLKTHVNVVSRNGLFTKVYAFWL